MVSSNEATPMGSVHKFRGNRVGEVCVFAVTLCKYDMRKGDLFVVW